MANQLNMEQAGKLLHVLSTDDGVRAQFQADPVGTIQQVTGANLSEVSECCTVGTLASKEAIAQARTQLFGRLTSVMEQAVHELDAS